MGKADKGGVKIAMKYFQLEIDSLNKKAQQILVGLAFMKL